MEPTNADALLHCPVCRDITGHHEVTRSRCVYRCLRCGKFHSVAAYYHDPKPKVFKVQIPGNPELNRNRKKGRRMKYVNYKEKL